MPIMGHVKAQRHWLLIPIKKFPSLQHRNIINIRAPMELKKAIHTQKYHFQQ
jgi:hypothetical protein